MPDPRLSTPNKVKIVANTYGHIPYKRHFQTGVTAHELANEVTSTDCMFDFMGMHGTDKDCD